MFSYGLIAIAHGKLKSTCNIHVFLAFLLKGIFKSCILHISIGLIVISGDGRALQGNGCRVGGVSRIQGVSPTERIAWTY